MDNWYLQKLGVTCHCQLIWELEDAVGHLIPMIGSGERKTPIIPKPKPYQGIQFGANLNVFYTFFPWFFVRNIEWRYKHMP